MTKGKWLTIALVISLGINLLLAGFVIGTKFRSPPSGMMMNPMFGLMRYAEGLPTQRREELLKEMRGFHPKGRTEFRMMRELQANVRAEIRREPLDPVALKAALTALQTRMQAHQSTSHDAFVQLMQSLTPAERVALDEQMQPRTRHHPRGSGKPPSPESAAGRPPR